MLVSVVLGILQFVQWRQAQNFIFFKYIKTETIHNREYAFFTLTNKSAINIYIDEVTSCQSYVKFPFLWRTILGERVPVNCRDASGHLNRFDGKILEPGNILKAEFALEHIAMLKRQSLHGAYRVRVSLVINHSAQKRQFVRALG